MTFQDWLCETCVKWQSEKNGQMRFGQYLFNSLSNIRKDIADDLLDMDYTFENGIDPFYLDKYVGNFLAFVHQNWSK